MQLTRTNAVFSRIALVSSFCAEKSTFGKYPDFYSNQHNSPEDPRSRKGGRCGCTRQPHPSWARPHPRPCPHGVWAPRGSPQVVFGLRKLPELLFMEEKISPDFDDIFRVGFLKPKTAGNTELALWHPVNRLVSENS